MKDDHRVTAASSSPCAPDARALKVIDNFQGWGNRMGWWLTAAALGEAVALSDRG